MSDPTAAPASGVPREATLCFADLAGFTALTEAHGDELAADYAERLAALARAALGPEDRLVKAMGDAVLISSASPRAGVDMVGRLVDAVRRVPDFPALRVGLHHGVVVERAGDVFGAAVNLAARVAAAAGGDEVLSTSLVAEAAQAMGHPARSLGPRHFKNVREAVEVFALDLSDRALPDVDPVCRMRVDRASCTAMVRHEGRVHYFCSLDCLAEFTAHPEAYAASS